MPCVSLFPVAYFLGIVQTTPALPSPAPAPGQPAPSPRPSLPTPPAHRLHGRQHAHVCSHAGLPLLRPTPSPRPAAAARPAATAARQPDADPALRQRQRQHIAGPGLWRRQQWQIGAGRVCVATRWEAAEGRAGGEEGGGVRGGLLRQRGGRQQVVVLLRMPQCEESMGSWGPHRGRTSGVGVCHCPRRRLASCSCGARRRCGHSATRPPHSLFRWARAHKPPPVRLRPFLTAAYCPQSPDGSRFGLPPDPQCPYATSPRTPASNPPTHPPPRPPPVLTSPSLGMGSEGAAAGRAEAEPTPTPTPTLARRCATNWSREAWSQGRGKRSREWRSGRRGMKGGLERVDTRGAAVGGQRHDKLEPDPNAVALPSLPTTPSLTPILCPTMPRLTLLAASTLTAFSRCRDRYSFFRDR